MISFSAIPRLHAVGSVFLAGLVCVATVTGLDRASIGAEWSLTGKVDQRFEFDDNARLRSSGSDVLYGSTTSPEGRYRYRSPTLDFNVFARLDFSRYSDSLFDTEDQELRTSSTYRTERGIFALDGNLERDSTRTSEVDDTGNFETLATRLSYNVRPSYSYQLSQRDLVRLNFDYTGVDYDTRSLTGYRFYSGGASWENVYSRQTTLSIGVNASLQDAENATQSSFYVLQVGAVHSFSPRLQVSASAGPRFSEQETPLGTDTGIGVQFAAGVDYSISEQTTISATVSQSVTPSSGGASRERRTINVSANHQFLPRLTFVLPAYFQDDSDPNTNSTASDRTYFSVSPGLRWQITQDWDLSANYRYRWQEQGSGATASSHAAIVGFNYHPKAWFLAR